MKKIKQNLKRLQRKHAKKLKERRKEEEEIFSAFCSLPGVSFSVIIYDGQGNLITLGIDDFEMKVEAVA